MELPVRFAASDSQRQGRGRVSSGMRVRIIHQPGKCAKTQKVGGGWSGCKRLQSLRRVASPQFYFYGNALLADVPGGAVTKSLRGSLTCRKLTTPLKRLPLKTPIRSAESVAPDPIVANAQDRLCRAPWSARFRDSPLPCPPVPRSPGCCSRRQRADASPRSLRNFWIFGPGRTIGLGLQRCSGFNHRCEGFPAAAHGPIGCVTTTRRAATQTEAGAPLPLTSGFIKSAISLQRR